VPVVHFKIDKDLKKSQKNLGANLSSKLNTLKAYIAGELSCTESSLSKTNISLETRFVNPWWSSLIKPIEIEIFCSPFPERLKNQTKIAKLIARMVRRELAVPRRTGIKVFIIFAEIGFN
jgi:hypothetical protein